VRGRRRHTGAPRQRLRGGGDAWQLVQVRRHGQGVQGTRGGMQRGVGDVEGEARAPQARVPQQQLEAAQVDAGFEPMGREAVPLIPRAE
jgi:hypothetical protein